MIARYADNVRNLNLKDVQAAANETLKPDNFVWLIVGDKTEYEEKLKTAGIEVHEIDVDGNIINEDLETPKSTESPK